MSKHASMYEAAMRAADKLDATPGGKKAAEDVRRLIRSHRAVVQTASEQSAEIQRLRLRARDRLTLALAELRAQIDKIEAGRPRDIDAP